MKHYILPVLFWALATSPIFAQKTLPPSALKALEKLPKTLQNTLQTAGYDQPNASILLTPATASRNPLQLDSTKSFFGYNLNGVPDSTPLIRSIFQYPQTGVVIEIQAQFSGNVWSPVTRQIKTRDAQDRPLELVAEEFDAVSQDFIPGSRLQFFPRGNDAVLIDSVNAFLWDTDLNSWTFAFQLVNTFNAQEQLLTAQTNFVVNGQLTSFLDQYAYNSSGDNHLIESFLLNNGFSVPSGKQENMYLNHLLIQDIVFTSSGGITFTPTDRNTYAYNSANLVIQQNSYTWAPGVNDWKPQQTISFKYDNAKRLIQKEIEFIQDAQKERTTYAYIEDENLSLESTYLWNIVLQTYVLDNRNYYYYSDGISSVLPDPRITQPLLLSPNPTIGAVRFSLNSAAEIKVFDGTGKVVQSRLLQPNEALNLDNLPPGMYTVTAQIGTMFYTGKVIKQ